MMTVSGLCSCLAVAWLLLQSLPLFAAEPVIPDPQWSVARAQFTSAIRNREPVDQLVVATPRIKEVYFFTDLRHLEGRTVTHRWEYQGKVISRVPFKVRGPRWRVNSKKEIDPDQIGEWSVTVVDESGWPLYTEMFRYENGSPVLLPVDVPVPESATGAVQRHRSAVPHAPLTPAATSDTMSQQDSDHRAIPSRPSAGVEVVK